MKDSISKPSTLDFLNADKTFSVQTGELKYALEAALMQKNDKEKMVSVQYESRSFTKSERMNSALKKEAESVILAWKKFRHHMFGGPLVVYNDHIALRSAFAKVNIMEGLPDGCM